MAVCDNLLEVTSLTNKILLHFGGSFHFIINDITPPDLIMALSIQSLCIFFLSAIEMYVLEILVSDGCTYFAPL